MFSATCAVFFVFVPALSLFHPSLLLQLPAFETPNSTWRAQCACRSRANVLAGQCPHGNKCAHAAPARILTQQCPGDDLISFYNAQMLEIFSSFIKTCVVLNSCLTFVVNFNNIFYQCYNSFRIFWLKNDGFVKMFYAYI